MREIDFVTLACYQNVGEGQLFRRCGRPVQSGWQTSEDFGVEG